MHIYSVTDPEFKPYGRVWDDVPSALTAPLTEALAATPVPEGSKYVASAPELEQVEGADTLGLLMYGGRSFQLGWCNGHNTKLNCLEYHRDSEFNLGTEDFILLLAKMDDITDGKLDTAKGTGTFVVGWARLSRSVTVRPSKPGLALQIEIVRAAPVVRLDL